MLQSNINKPEALPSFNRHANIVLGEIHSNAMGIPQPSSTCKISTKVNALSFQPEPQKHMLSHISIDPE